MNRPLKTICTVECRMNSSRLPGKMMLKFGDKTIIEFIVNRLRKSRYIDEVVIATTTNPLDDEIEKLCQDKRIKYFRGSEDNVIDRVASAINQYPSAKLAVSVTGDCPFVYPSMIDYLIHLQKKHDYDYVSNDVIDRSFPDGLDVQIFKPQVLFKTIPLVSNPIHLCHSAWNIPTYGKDLFDIFHWKAPKKFRWPELGLTLDEPKDYEFLKSIYEATYDERHPDDMFSVYDLITFLRQHPEIITNRDIRRKTPGNG